MGGKARDREGGRGCGDYGKAVEHTQRKMSDEVPQPHIKGAFRDGPETGRKGEELFIYLECQEEDRIKKRGDNPSVVGRQKSPKGSRPTVGKLYEIVGAGKVENETLLNIHQQISTGGGNETTGEAKDLHPHFERTPKKCKKEANGGMFKI